MELSLDYYSQEKPTMSLQNLQKDLFSFKYVFACMCVHTCAAGRALSFPWNWSHMGDENGTPIL